jgi:hypothetical protein
METRKKNVGSFDRMVRTLAAIALLVAAAMAPLSLTWRLGGLAPTGIYFLFTALSGTCLGYRLMGRSTCPNTPNIQ